MRSACSIVSEHEKIYVSFLLLSPLPLLPLREPRLSSKCEFT